MKKSLVALAALAVVGAASAQVSITGTTSFSYQKDLSGTAGIAMSDNSIFLGDTEDLGGGTKLVMSTGFDAGGRSNAGNGNFGQENSSLTVSGSFGSIKLMSFESDGPFAAIDGLSGASLSTGVFDMGAGTNTPKVFRNGVSYSAPSMAGFTPALTYVTKAGQWQNSDPLSAATKVVPAVTYVAGPLKLYVEDAIFNASYNNNADDQVSQITATALYDFGAAQVGAGWTKPTNKGSTYTVGVSVPVGAVTLGLATFSYAGPNSASNVGTSNFTEGSIGYALSKRTTLKASFAQVNDNFNAYAGNTAAGATNGEYRVGLFHSF